MMVEEFATQYAGKLKVETQRGRSSRSCPALHDIRGIPALLFFNQGAVVDTVVGAVPQGSVAEAH